MQETSTLDTLSQSTEHAGNFVWLVVLSVVGLAVLLWFAFRPKPQKVENKAKISEPETKTTEPKLFIPSIDTKKVVIPKTNEQKPNIEPEVEKKVEPKIIVPPSTPKVVAQPPPEQIPEPLKPKHIGYTPINLFEQTEPLKFPYVIMPKPNCVIKFPQKGRSGRKGYKEKDFKTYLTKYFKNSFQLFDDRFILVKGRNNPYEPDFTLIDEEAEINIFLDVEIDEPYEGINNIEKRKATHFRFADTNRNNAIKNRGWIVIRFAEIQVHQNPNSCCLFVADVIANIHPQFKIATELLSSKRIIPIPQWTKEEAEKMSREKYRERYLGIDSFGFEADNSQITASETELGKETEELVKDEPAIIISPTVQPIVNLNHDLIQIAINNNHFISFVYSGTPTIVKPIRYSNGTLDAYCYIKNTNRVFIVANILNPIVKQRPFTLEATSPSLGIDRIATIVNTAIRNKMFIRMRYTRSAWTTYAVDHETGEVIIADNIEAEESIRTISNIQLAINNPETGELWFTPNENYITSYCHRREAERMFRFDRISELAILNIN